MRRYEPGKGVLPFVWHFGGSHGDDVPKDRGIVIVEIWKTSVHSWELLKPKARVEAQFETWVHRSTQWHRVKPNGDLEPIAEMPFVRRWAITLGYMAWEGTVVLEGWR